MKSKTKKLSLNDFGSYLGRDKGCLIIRDKERNEKRYPLFDNEIGEIQVRSGNSISTGALTTCWILEHRRHSFNRTRTTSRNSKKPLKRQQRQNPNMPIRILQRRPMLKNCKNFSALQTGRTRQTTKKIRPKKI